MCVVSAVILLLAIAAGAVLLWALDQWPPEDDE